jgi:outer membrane protein insertion porin family
MTKMEFGIKGFYNNKIGHSPFEGYLVGGDGMGYYSRMGQETIGLRGYANYALTPNYKQDNAYNKYTLELRYPFALKPSATIFALAFLEGGNSWYDLKELNPFMVKRAAGIGLRAFLPMFGMLGIDWGYGFDPVFDENGSPQHKGQFHFTIGQQF